MSTTGIYCSKKPYSSASTARSHIAHSQALRAKKGKPPRKLVESHCPNCDCWHIDWKK